MSEIKYTVDGKKVVVLGSLNAQEKIVQEIFVTNDGAEIPAGENFVAKSLLDVPAESWKSKEAKRIDELLSVGKNKLESQGAELRQMEQEVIKPLKEKIRLLALTEKNINPEAFRIVSDFLEGKMKYAVYVDYSHRIVDFSVEGCAMIDRSYGRPSFEKLKLISLMGSTDGDMLWRIHTYSDYSGGGTDVYLCATLEEAKQKLIDSFATVEAYNDENLIELRKWGITPDPDKFLAHKNTKIANIKATIDDLESKLATAKEKMVEFSKEEPCF